MPENTGNIGQTESASNSPNRDNWQSVGSVAERLKRKCEDAMRAGHFELAEAYHAKLIETEAGE